jgi:hypothetical protein
MLCFSQLNQVILPRMERGRGRTWWPSLKPPLGSTSLEQYHSRVLVNCIFCEDGVQLGPGGRDGGSAVKGKIRVMVGQEMRRAELRAVLLPKCGVYDVES